VDWADLSDGIDARIGVTAHKNADSDSRASQIEPAIAQATRRGRTTGAMSITEARHRARAGIVDERTREAADRPQLTRHRIDGIGFGSAINQRLKPRLVCSTLELPD
jgi:hypothetical protein